MLGPSCRCLGGRCPKALTEAPRFGASGWTGGHPISDILADDSNVYYAERLFDSEVTEGGYPMRWMRRSIATGKTDVLADHENMEQNGGDRALPAIRDGLLFWEHIHPGREHEDYVDSIRAVPIGGGRSEDSIRDLAGRVNR